MIMDKKIAVIGAGVMGCGVAQVFAQCGYQVILHDQSQAVLEKAISSIHQNTRIIALMGKQEDTSDEVMKRIVCTTNLDEAAGVSYIIENITELVEEKEALYTRMRNMIQPDAIVMVNTSCISITYIASLLKEPKHVIGTHFMNPVPMMDAVEVIRGYHTCDSTMEMTTRIIGDIGKEAIVVNDMPGFVSNRISHLMMNEAAFVVQDQVAEAKVVDEIFRKCYSHKMGPLETADLIGLDTVVQSLDILYTNFQDSKYRCCPLLRKMVDAGLLGRKSGQGFYTY